MDIKLKYGNREHLPPTVTPGAVYYVNNEETKQGEIYYDLLDSKAGEAANETNRRSVIGGGIYVGSGPLPEGYILKIDPNGVENEMDALATTTQNGLMRAEDKRRLDQLWRYFGNLRIDISDTAPDDSNEPSDMDIITLVLP